MRNEAFIDREAARAQPLRNDVSAVQTAPRIHMSLPDVHVVAVWRQCEELGEGHSTVTSRHVDDDKNIFSVMTLDFELASLISCESDCGGFSLGCFTRRQVITV